jgi:hypothetical protein
MEKELFNEQTKTEKKQIDVQQTYPKILKKFVDIWRTLKLFVMMVMNV